MSKTITINCQQRTTGKTSRSKMKKEDKVPGIIYSKGETSIPVAFNGKNLNHLFSTHGPRGLFSLELEGTPAPIPAVVRELQRNPISRSIIHVDFMQVNLSEKIEEPVAVQISGEEGLHDKGAVLQIDAREVQVSGLPQNIPEYLVVDISALAPGDQITAADLTLPAGIELVSDPDLVILSILHEARPAEEESSPEPEAEASDLEK